MPVKVVDASAIGALLFGEPDGPDIAHRLSGSRLVVPELLFFEVASICLKKLKRYFDRRHSILEAPKLLKRLSMESVEVDHSEVVLLAERYGLTAYDANYLFHGIVEFVGVPRQDENRFCRVPLMRPATGN